jgi:hypothetical protein
VSQGEIADRLLRFDGAVEHDRETPASRRYADRLHENGKAVIGE